MIAVPFWKVESIGNDFVLVHGEAAGLDFATMAIQACRRRLGVGADGLLSVESAGMGRIRMRMFNPDGTEDFCGNGLRCAAVHACGQGWVDGEFVIEHGGIEVPTRNLGSGLIETRIGRASYSPSDVPLASDSEWFDTEILEHDGQILMGSALSTGSTHTIIWGDALPDDRFFFEVGPRIEHDPRFPMRTSVIWAVEQRVDKISIRIWERGAGETQGCGTGSSAAVVDLMRRRNHGGTVEVANPGGSVWIQADAWDAPITARGPAEELFTGELRLSLP